MKGVPRLILIGAGKFGINHLRVWRELEKKGKIFLVSVVVRTEKSKKKLERLYNVPVFTKINANMLKKVDAVDIATPYDTHYSLAKKCLKYTNVFIEKPLAETFQRAESLKNYAKANKKILMVGHIFRFHPVTKEIKSLLLRRKLKPKRIFGRFISPISTYKKLDALFEKPHFFDILDYILEKDPSVLWSKSDNFVMSVDLRYPGGIDARLQIGWVGNNKERILEFEVFNEKITCDFAKNIIVSKKIDGSQKTIYCDAKREPLETELSMFIDILNGKVVDYPDAKLGAKIVGIAEKINSSHKRKKVKKVAVIGGGIFGATCAIVLGKKFNVTLFERHEDLLQEASWANQYRHHMGYHYPRDEETVRQIQKDKKDFQKLYGHTVKKNFTSYYGVAKEGSYTGPANFMKFCERFSLPYEKEYPKPVFLNPSVVSTCLKTPESIFDYQKLKSFVEKKIVENKNINLKLGCSVVGARLDETGKKILKILHKNRKTEKNFDYIINATYANRNRFCQWMKFLTQRLKFNFKEVIVLKLPTKKNFGVTIMDGSFATYLPMHIPGMFTFGHVDLSVLESKTGELPDEVTWFKRPRTRWHESQKHCLEWMPILKQAEYIESMFVVLPIYPEREKTRGRPTDVTYHGFGCWSVLSGKIISSVSVAKQILNDIETLV